MLHRASLLLAFLATPAAAQAPRAWLSDSNLDQLFTVDLQTGAATLVGSTAGILGTPAGLAWREDTQTLWTVDLDGGEVGTIDPLTGTFTQVWTANPTAGWQGIDWDHATQRFYLLNQSNQMYSLDPNTGSTTLLGPTGATLTGAIESDAAGTLWAINFSPANLYHINKVTGAATLVVATTPAGVQGMAFSQDGTLYAANSNDDSLYTIDTATGATTRIGAHGASIQFVKGMEIAGSCSGAFALSGIGCNDASSVRVTMTRSGTPCVAQTVRIGASVGALTPAYVLMLGTSNQTWGALPLPFSLAPFGNPGCSIYASQDVPLGALPPTVTLPLAIPNNPTLSGLVVHFQALVIDPRLGGLGVATSNLLSMRVGR